MRDIDESKNGDSNSSLDDLFSLGPETQEASRYKQTINDILSNGEEPTDEFLEEFVALHEAPPLSDEEFERQALNNPIVDEDSGKPD